MQGLVTASVTYDLSTLADTDGDGLTDTEELGNTHTDPYDSDSDNDGPNDGQEIGAGTNPNNPDTDGDGLTDGSDPFPLDPTNGDPGPGPGPGPDPGPGGDDGDDGGGSFSWKMAERYNGSDRDRDGLADYFTPLNYKRFRPWPLDANVIAPSVWWVELDAGAACAGKTVQWLVDGQPGGHRCKQAVVLSETAHIVTLSLDGKPAGRQTVTPKDWLIAAIGDSYGSGEGNPDVPRKRRPGPGEDTRSRWESKQCHRSASAAAALAAANVEKADSHSSVTLLHLSCSGAQIPDGAIGSYAGARPDEGKPLKSQVKQLQNLLDRRRPDALLLSLGGNDIGFSDIVIKCLLGKRCYRKGSAAHDVFDRGIRALPSRYNQLAAALKNIGVDDAKVIVTAYPDPTRHDDGEICGTGQRKKLLFEAPGVPKARQISIKEARWASETVLATLNRTLRQIAGDHHWRYVDAHVARSRRHGDCARDSWFVTWDQAKRRQETYRQYVFHISPGVIHPNEQGHRAYRDAILPALGSFGLPVG